MDGILYKSKGNALELLYADDLAVTRFCTDRFGCPAATHLSWRSIAALDAALQTEIRGSARTMLLLQNLLSH